MQSGEPVPFPGFDASKPSIARVFDYWLGGKDNFKSDRVMAEQIRLLWPGIIPMCRDSRKFVINAVTWAASQGIDQFVDLGAGIPTHPSVHEAVREIIPDARVCYVDNDPMASGHTAALLAKPDGIAAVQADLSRPDATWNNPSVRAVIDTSRPVCVILAMMLHFFAPEVAREITARYVSLLVPGSTVVISVARGDGDEAFGQRLRDNYTAGTVYNHSREDIETFFAGLEFVPPGLVYGYAWRGGMAGVPQRQPDEGYVLGGVGLKRHHMKPASR